MAKFLKKQTKQRHPTLNFQNLEIANQFHTGTFNSLGLTPQNKSSDSVTNLLKWSPACATQVLDVALMHISVFDVRAASPCLPYSAHS